MSEPQTYQEFQDEVKTEQGGMTRDEVEALMRKRNEHLFNPDNAPSQTHRWVDRGQVMSCEGAAHPNHRVFKRR